MNGVDIVDIVDIVDEGGLGHGFILSGVGMSGRRGLRLPLG